MSRSKALVLTAMLAGCHLIGGTDGLVIIDSGDESNSVTTTAATGGAPATSASSTGGGATCNDDVCAQNAGECKTCSCLEGIVCDCDPVAFGQACTGGYCDSDGTCVPCIDNVTFTCPNDLNCVDKTCVAASCTDGAPNGGETDLDCGGPCPPCANGDNCIDNDDCTSALCAQTVCMQCNQHSECGTQRYCEGNVCHPKKAYFESCSAHYQCLSNYCGCLGNVCGCV